MRETRFSPHANSINVLQLLRNNVSIASVQNKHVPSIRIQVTIEHKGKPIEVIALVDSGAEGNYLHGNFIHKHNLKTHELEPPVYVKNVNGTINQQGLMTQAAEGLRVRVEEKTKAFSKEDLIRYRGGRNGVASEKTRDDSARA